MGSSINIMESLSEFCMIIFDSFLTAESSIINNVGTIEINGIKYSDVKIESSGMKEYINSFFDPNDLSGSINPNNLEGQLSEEEWKKYELMFTKAMNEANSKNEKAAVAAVFMTSVYPHMPYDWGGGHYLSDYDCKDSINRDLGETYNGMPCNYLENKRLRTYDCSGFTSWVLKEAGYPKTVWSNGETVNDVDHLISNAKSTQQFGKTFNINNCSVGDVAYMHNEEPIGDYVYDHIGVIVAKEGDVITVSHISGGSNIHLQSESAGLGYTKINTKTGEVVDDSTCKKDEIMGKVYFTHVAKME